MTTHINFKLKIMTGTIIYLVLLYCGLSLMRDIAKILDYINNYKSKNDETNN